MVAAAAMDHRWVVIREGYSTSRRDLGILHWRGGSVCVWRLLTSRGRVGIWVGRGHWSHRGRRGNWRWGHGCARGHRGGWGGDMGWCDGGEGSDGDL